MNKKLLRLSLAALSLAVLSPAHAAAADVMDAKPASLVKLLSEAGYKPQLRAGDAKTQPSIALKVQENDVYLYFSGCKDGLCRRVTASNGFEFPKDRSGLAGTLAGWNAEWYSQAYEDKEAVYLDASYMLTGGFTKANFNAWFGEYLEELGEFGDKLY
ncbi:YbjN domain-containing protein [Deinococcus hopiensis]|uniref:Putative sensory transduction regulator n=1 Tax=Deinococcus hopiensis KR-140 TaxID=695939 RepID=A0A1W1UAV9_9DEIO|nr:YbjN domain-containing protein [Deinococcus hopiensis]SMB78183.1 Putative sensory transduction regulator [Deinococcus hopiensis KR-140]